MTGAVKAPLKLPVMTVDEVFGEYWEKEGSFKVSGWDAILPRLRRFSSFFNGGRNWHEVTDKDISDYVLKRRHDFVPITKNYKSGKVIEYTNRRISPASINKELATLGRVKSFADDILGIEPAPFKIKRHTLNEEDKQTRALTADQESELLACLPDYWADAVEFLFESGFRAKHLFPRKRYTYKPLRRRDVNLEECEVTIWSKSPNVPGGQLFTKTITPRAMEILIDRGIEYMDPNDVVFTYPASHKYAGQPLGDYRNTLYRAMAEAGIDRAKGEGMHLTRRTFATNLKRGDLPAEEIQEQLMHSNPRTTKKYLRVDSKTKASRVNQALRKAKNLWSDKGD